MRHVVHFPRHAGDRTIGCRHLKCVKILARIFVRPKVRCLRLHHGRVQQIAVDADVEQFGFRPLLGLAHTDLFQRNPPANQAVRIVQIAGQNRLGRTNHFARGLVSHLHPRSIEITFGGGVTIGIDVKRIIGTSLHAGFTTDAPFVVEIDDAIGTTEKCHRGTNFDTRRVVAMVAAQHCEVSPRVGIESFFDVLDPGSIHADGDVVLFLAGHRAGMTADATVLIDDESVAHS